MFEITIKGETLEEFHANLQQLAAQFGGVPTRQPVEDGKLDPQTLVKTRKPKAAAQPAPEPEPEPTGDDEEDGDADLLAPAEPLPETAKQVVDAGTGKPAAPAAADAPVKMTIDDVRAAAAKLAAKDTAKLGELLKTYGAAKLSEVPKGKLADFASDVMEALG